MNVSSVSFTNGYSYRKVEDNYRSKEIHDVSARANIGNWDVQIIKSKIFMFNNFDNISYVQDSKNIPLLSIDDGPDSIELKPSYLFDKVIRFDGGYKYTEVKLTKYHYGYEKDKLSYKTHKLGLGLTFIFPKDVRPYINASFLLRPDGNGIYSLLETEGDSNVSEPFINSNNRSGNTTPMLNRAEIGIEKHALDITKKIKVIFGMKMSGDHIIFTDDGIWPDQGKNRNTYSLYMNVNSKVKLSDKFNQYFKLDYENSLTTQEEFDGVAIGAVVNAMLGFGYKYENVEFILLPNVSFMHNGIDYHGEAYGLMFKVAY